MALLARPILVTVILGPVHTTGPEQTVRPWANQLVRGSTRRCARGAFTLIDVLVSISIVAVLIGILLPAISGVNESARRLICRSNVRQIGLGIAMYVDDNKGLIPYSVYMPPEALVSPAARRAFAKPGAMMTERLAPEDAAAWNATTFWDGIGRLFAHDYLSTGKIYFCPSHTGEHPYSQYASLFGELDGEVEIVGNYHYRGYGPTVGPTRERGTYKLYQIEPAQSSLLSDGLQTVADYNHKVGSNIFRADLSVGWLSDPGQQLLAVVAATGNADGVTTDDVWDHLDDSDLTNRQGIGPR